MILTPLPPVRPTGFTATSKSMSFTYFLASEAFERAETYVARDVMAFHDLTGEALGDLQPGRGPGRTDASDALPLQSVHQTDLQR